MTVEQWPRDAWLDAIWDDATLKPSERAVAYVFARYAGKKDTTWCGWEELMRRTGLKSKNGVWLAQKGLVNAGWLVEIEKARQHYSARYRMAIPQAQESPEETTQRSPQETSEPPRGPLRGSSGLFQGSSRLIQGPDLSNLEIKPIDQTGGHAAPQTPLRENDPSGRSNDQRDLLSERGTDQTDLGTQPTTARASPENVVDFEELKYRREMRMVK